MKHLFYSSLALCLSLLSTACSQAPLAAPQGLQPQRPPALRNVQALREPLSAIMGDAPNFAASSNGSLLTVVSGPQGRGAKAGALVETFYPSLGEDHLWDAYNGLWVNGEFVWLHDLELLEQSVLPQSDIVVSRFADPAGRFQVETQDFVHKGQDTHTRQIQIQNSSQQPLELAVFFYENMTINVFPTGDRCEYRPDIQALHHYENKIHFAIGADHEIAQFQCGGVKNLLTRALDAMHDAEDGELRNNPGASAGAGLGVNGALASEVQSLAPGQKLSRRYFLAAGQSPEEAFKHLQAARQQSVQQSRQENLNYWQNYLEHSQIVPGMSPEERAVYERALIVIQQHSAASGAHIAAPTSTSPPYRFSWPRDGSYIALAELKSGHPENARKFLEFMARNQKPNGSWAINYHTTGQAFYDFGDRNNEHDQVGTIPWMMVEYAQHTGDMNWLQQQWPTIQSACEYLIQKTDLRTGLLGPTRDLWELSTSDTWTYSNAAGYAGLQAGAFSAELRGDLESAARYHQAAEKIKRGIHTWLWHEGGYYGRGINLGSDRVDPKVEAANLALAYPFKVFAVDDPRMVKMAERILADLSSPEGGVRRYTDDRYYDGQPWPVTTEWLSIYYSLLGQKDLAARLHGASTRYALSTGSLQLGEQYDERQKRWVSALPLTWSGAKYILAAQALHAP